MADRITCTYCHGHGKETSPTGRMHECRQCDGYGYTLKPTRITLSRAKGWRKPAGAITVARPSIWGNPWRIGTPGTIDLVLDGAKSRYKILICLDALDATISYENWLRGDRIWGVELPDMDQFTDAGKMALNDHLHARRKLILANLDQLRGHDLCCWCKPGEPCHADVLLKLANGDAARRPKDGV